MTLISLFVLLGGVVAAATLLRDLAAAVLPEQLWRTAIAMGVAAWAAAATWMAIFSLTPKLVGLPVLGPSGPWPPTPAMTFALGAAAVVFTITAVGYAHARRPIHVAVTVFAAIVVTQLIVTSARQLSLPFALCCWGWVLLAVCIAQPKSPTHRLRLRLGAVALLLALYVAFPQLPASTRLVLKERLIVADAFLITRTAQPPAQRACAATGSSKTLDVGTAQSTVLIVVDTLRVDRVEAALMPNLSAWTADATLTFARSYAPAPSTDKSFASMFALDAERNLFERMHAAGVTVGAVSSHPGVTSILEKSGIGDVDGSAYDGEDFRFALTSHTVTDVALARLAELRAAGDPFLLVVHYYDPHEYYVPNDVFDFGSSRAKRYDAEVAYTDLHLGRLLDETDDIATFVATDHGEELWDHGYVSHTHALYDESTRVFIAGKVPNARAQTVEHPVLNDVVGDAVSAVMLGQRLQVREEPLQLAMKAKRATVIGDHKWIWNGESGVPELYNLAEDPGERVNLFDEARLATEPSCIAAFAD